MTPTQTVSLAFFNFSGWELAIILVLGLLIFGRRLPELGRSVGKTIVEFKKGLSDVQSDVHNSTTQAGNQPNYNQPAGTLPPGAAGSTSGQQAQSTPSQQNQR